MTSKQFPCFSWNKQKMKFLDARDIEIIHLLSWLTVVLARYEMELCWMKSLFVSIKLISYHLKSTVEPSLLNLYW